MNSEEFKERTARFALEVISLVDKLPSRPTAWVLSKQLVRAATSVGANYRSACRARSRADFINKMGHVEEEADESAYWLELLERSNLCSGESVHNPQREANELTWMAVASVKTARFGKQS